MKTVILIVAVLATAISCHCTAQDAKYAALTQAESTQVKQAYQAIQTAQAKYDAIKAAITEKYTRDVVPSSVPTCASASGANSLCDPSDRTSFIETKAGWENGVEFTEDFNGIVPKPYTTTNIGLGGCAYYGLNTTLTEAFPVMPLPPMPKMVGQ